MKPVSAETERLLRSALARLLARQPTVCDGRLTVTNLAREAGVARATANRAEVVLAELRQANALKRSASPKLTAEADDGQESRRANEHILAQHIQLRALLRGNEQHRSLAIGNIVPIVRR